MADDKSVDDVIEVVIPTLDNGMAIVMLISGVVVGAFLLYLYTNYRSNLPPKTESSSILDGAQNLLPELLPSLRGQSATQPIDYSESAG